MFGILFSLNLCKYGRVGFLPIFGYCANSWVVASLSIFQEHSVTFSQMRRWLFLQADLIGAMVSYRPLLWQSCPRAFVRPWLLHALIWSAMMTRTWMRPRWVSWTTTWNLTLIGTTSQMGVLVDDVVCSTSCLVPGPIFLLLLPQRRPLRCLSSLLVQSTCYGWRNLHKLVARFNFWFLFFSRLMITLTSLYPQGRHSFLHTRN